MPKATKTTKSTKSTKATKATKATSNGKANNNGLSSLQSAILNQLKSGKALSYGELRTSIGVQRGYSKAVLTGEQSLVNRKFATEVTIEPKEGERQVKRFKITALGKKKA